MRLSVVALLLAASSTAWAGDRPPGGRTTAETPAVAASNPAAGDPASVPPAPTVAVPYAGLYDAPLFGHGERAVDKVDETALRFYAGQRNRTRVDAEIKRLRGLHPEWQVPANLYASGAGDDEQPLWDLFAAGRTEELRAAIQAREAREPEWRPSADLIAKLSRQETAASLKALSEAKEWDRLLVLADAHPDGFGCGTIDLDWRIAEAFVHVGLPARAYEVDAAVLKACTSGDERLATVRKAIGLLPGADVERLIASGRPLADGSGEFDAARLDFARHEIGDATARANGAAVAPTILSALGAATLRSGDPGDAALLGWYDFAHQQPAEADGWFKLGLAATVGDVKMAEGHALALRDLGRRNEAEEIAHAWRDRSRPLRGLFVALITARMNQPDAAPVAASDLSDLAAILEEDHDVPAAGALAWAAYGRHDLDDAALWFGRAVDWARPGDVPETVVEGYGLTLVGLGRLDAVEEVLYAQRERSPGIAQLYLSVAVATLSSGDADLPPGMAGPTRPSLPIPPERMDRFAAAVRAARSTRGAGALGWRNLRDGLPLVAVDWFREARRWSPNGTADIKTVEGLVLALKAGGDLRGAEDEAFARLAESARLRDAYRGVMVAELTAPDAADQLAEINVARFADRVDSETWTDGAQALGWYRLGRGAAERAGCGYGVDWFRRAIAWSPDRRGTAKDNEGYAQALQRAGRDLAAADVAEAWADRAPDMKALAIKIMAEALTRELFPRHVTEDRVDRMAALVRTDRSVSGAQALGWYRYRDAGAGYGVGWFEQAIQWSPDRQADAKTVEGYASALRDVGRLAEAEEALFPWIDRVPLMRDLYIDTAVSELTLDNPPEPMPAERLARLIAVATPVRSAAAAQAIGWYRFARGEDRDAVTWFKTAVDWWPQLPPDADRFTYVAQSYQPLQSRLALKPEDYRRTPRAFASRVHDPDSSQHRYVDTFGGLATTWTGYALALQAVGRTAEAADIAYQWRERWPAMSRVFVDIGIAALTAPDGGAALSPDRIKRFAAVFEETRDARGAAALAWAATSRRDPNEAAVWFKAANDWRPVDAAADPTIVSGTVDALRAAGRSDEAFAVASQAAGGEPDAREKLLDVALDLMASAGDAARRSATDRGGPTGASPPTSGRLAEAVAVAEADTTARSATALGWYRLAIGRANDALPAFASAIGRAEAAAGPTSAPASDARVLPKAIEGYARTLLALGRDADALAFADAWSARVPAIATMPGDLVAEIVSRDGGASVLLPGAMDRMASVATRSHSAPAAAAFGWFSYRHRDWVKAAVWFSSAMAWAPDRRGSLKLAEGYAASLHNQCRFAEAESAALDHVDEAGADELRRIYVDSVADRVSRSSAGAAMLPAETARFAALTLATNSANGAQALGWYAYRSHQFAAAAAWFEKAVAWHATEAEVYGLALSLRRIGDGGGLVRVLDLYEGRYPSLAGVRAALGRHREPPIPDFGDLSGRSCAAGRNVDAAAAPFAKVERAPFAGPVAPTAAVALTSGAWPVDADTTPAERPRGPRSDRHASPTCRRPGAAHRAYGRSRPRPASRPATLRRSARRFGGARRQGLRSLSRDPGAATAAQRARSHDGGLVPARRRTLGRGRGGLPGRRAGCESAATARSAKRSRISARAIRTRRSRARPERGSTPTSVGSSACRSSRSRPATPMRRGAGPIRSACCGAVQAYASEPRDLVMLRGWAFYQTGDLAAARRAFRGGRRPPVRSGQPQRPRHRHARSDAEGLPMTIARSALLPLALLGLSACAGSPPAGPIARYAAGETEPRAALASLPAAAGRVVAVRRTGVRERRVGAGRARRAGRHDGRESDHSRGFSRRPHHVRRPGPDPRRRASFRRKPRRRDAVGASGCADDDLERCGAERRGAVRLRDRNARPPDLRLCMAISRAAAPPVVDRRNHGVAAEP